MNKVLLSVALALGLCGSGCFSQSTDKNDIRFVDVDRILTQSKTARVRDSHIEAVNQSLKADLEKLMQAMARAPEAERTVTLKKVEVHSGAGLVHVNLTTSLTTPMPKIV